MSAKARRSTTFLSTLSLRRATAKVPRRAAKAIISIHALLAESDCTRAGAWGSALRISIHALLAESDRAAVGAPVYAAISIHALLAESDPPLRWSLTPRRNFYPRSPCGERPDALKPVAQAIFISIHALLAESDSLRWSPRLRHRDFYPRSPCGERLLQGCR